MRRSLIAILTALLGACSGTSGGDDASAPGSDSGATADSAVPRGDAGDADGGDFFDGGDLFDSGLADAGPSTGCAYPSGAVEPMALGAAIWPYQWPEAIDGAGTNVPLDLTEVFCTEDENRDWSPFDVLVFISIPAW